MNDMRKTRIPAGTGTVFHGYENSKPVPVPVCTRDMILTVLPIPVTYLRYSKDLMICWKRCHHLGLTAAVFGCGIYLEGREVLETLTLVMSNHCGICFK